MFVVIVHLYACAKYMIRVGLVRKNRVIVNRVASATGQLLKGNARVLSNI